MGKFGGKSDGRNGLEGRIHGRRRRI